MEKAYLRNPQLISKELQTDLQNGLTKEDAQKRLLKYGPNTLKDEGQKSLFTIFLSQFSSFLIIILLIASAISFTLNEAIDALMILAIVILNAFVGFIQEYKVEKTIQQLKKLVTSNSFVFRDGKLTQIPSINLVPGDLISLEEGQKVPADIRLISNINLETNEASLTGESTPVNKDLKIILKETILAEQKNMLFCGTTIVSGKGMGIVISTGMATEIGKIAKLVSKEKEVLTPLQIKLNSLGKLIGSIVLAVAVIIGIEQVIFGEDILQALISSIALAVAAVPEGLPAVVTISLALGTKRLLKQKALIRNLAATETLGSVDIICTDKTGTLTEGIMSVRTIFVNNKLFKFDKSKDNFKDLDQLEKILTFGLLGSNARINDGQMIGDPTEGALVKIALDLGFEQEAILKANPRISEIPFTSERKMMSVVISNKEGNLLISKGSTEVILGRCTKIEINGQIRNLTETDRKQILKTHNDMANNALRILAIAFGNDKKEEGLTFLGLQGMIDAPRQGVKEAIDTCRNQAGIKIVMITGDHLLTAQAIGKELGIEGKSITGLQLDKLSDEQFEKTVEEITIYARVNPEHKIRIIKALKSHGHQVAMTGDGVNDAPALKAADIGVAMGITGTDVAKEASDMILLDDHFTTIVSAIKEGRAIFDNIRKFVNYLLSSNIMEVMVISLALLLGGGHLPLLPIHLLWINLVTDGLPAIALGIDPPRKNIMSMPSKYFREQIVGGKFLWPLITISLLLTLTIIAIFFIYQKDPTYEQTMVFTAIVFYEMLRIIAIRSEYNLSFFSNKYLILAMAGSLILHLMILYLPISFAGTTLQQVFKVRPLNLQDWLLLIGIGIFLFFVMRVDRILNFFYHKTYGN